MTTLPHLLDTRADHDYAMAIKLYRNLFQEMLCSSIWSPSPYSPHRKAGRNCKMAVSSLTEQTEVFLYRCILIGRIKWAIAAPAIDAKTFNRNVLYDLVGRWRDEENIAGKKIKRGEHKHLRA